MEPLTILGAMTGGISATSEILSGLEFAISTTAKIREAPSLALSTFRDLTMMRGNMVRFQQLFQNPKFLYSGSSNSIALLDVQTCFVGCVASLDELETALRPLKMSGLKGLALSARLEWVMKDKQVSQLCRKVHDAQASLGLMLSILQHESMMESEAAIADLSRVCQRIACDVAHLRANYASSMREMSTISDKNMDDSSTIRQHTVARPDSILLPRVTSMALEPGTFTHRFDFEDTLEESRVYMRALRSNNPEDMSFRSSMLNDHAWSQLSALSCLSMSNISTMTFVALPLCWNDISNANHYQLNSAMSDDVTLHNESMTPQSVPSPPYSPVLPAKLSVAKFLRAMKRPFELDIVEIPYDKRAKLPRSLPMTPITPITPASPSTFSARSSSEEFAVQCQYDVPSLSYLSGLHLKDSKWHLCHSESGLPCYGAVNSPAKKELDKKVIRHWQIEIAVNKGLFNGFCCSGCLKTLAFIFKTSQQSESVYEIWCGSKHCLSTDPDLKPCACFMKMWEQDMPLGNFFGIRIRPEKKVYCARCFTLCSACSGQSKAGGFDLLPTKMRSWDIRTNSGRLYQDQGSIIRQQDHIAYYLLQVDFVPPGQDKERAEDISELRSRLAEIETKEGSSSADVTRDLRIRIAIIKRRERILSRWIESRI